MVHDMCDLDTHDTQAQFIYQRHPSRHQRRLVRQHATQCDQFNQTFNSTFADSLPARSVNATSPPSTSSCKLAPNGTLTLGAKHELLDGNVQIEEASVMLGKVSLFRLWERERSKQEVTSLECTEGDLVTWWKGDWDAGACPSKWDTRLRCGEQK